MKRLPFLDRRRLRPNRIAADVTQLFASLLLTPAIRSPLEGRPARMDHFHTRRPTCGACGGTGETPVTPGHPERKTCIRCGGTGEGATA